MKKLILLLLTIPFASNADQWSDLEIWNVNKVDVTLYDIKDVGKLRLNLENENRYNEPQDNLYQYYFQGFLSIPLPLKGWSIAPGYKFEYNNDKNLYSNIYMLGLNYKYDKLFGTNWNYQLKNRLEIGDTEKAKDLTYKIRIKNGFSHDLPINGFNGKPCVITLSDEIFYLTNIDEFNENRALLDIEIPLRKNVGFTIGGGLRSKLLTPKTGERWSDGPMFTFGLHIDF